MTAIMMILENGLYFQVDATSDVYNREYRLRPQQEVEAFNLYRSASFQKFIEKATQLLKEYKKQ